MGLSGAGQGFLEVLAFWAGIGYISQEHSVEDHY